jgi:acetyl esterase
MSTTIPAIDVPEGVRHEVREYRRVNGHALRMLVFRPADAPATPRPAVIWFHGGGWHQGAPEQFARFCIAAVRAGMVAAAAQYRLMAATADSVFDCMDDARAAHRWMVDHADELGFDPRRLVVAGSSAGGHLAASIVTHAPAGDPATPPPPAAMVLLNPVVDCTASGFGQGYVGQRCVEASPIARVRPGMPPTLVIHGDADETVPYENAVRFDRLMREAGNRCTLVTIPGGRHGLWGHLPQRMIDEAGAFLANLGLVSHEPAAG